MTDVVVELGNGHTVHYYIEDGRSVVTLVSQKSSILSRAYKARWVDKALKILHERRIR